MSLLFHIDVPFRTRRWRPKRSVPLACNAYFLITLVPETWRTLIALNALVHSVLPAAVAAACSPWH